MTELELVTFYRKKRAKSYVYRPVRNLAITNGTITVKDVMRFRKCMWENASRHLTRAVKARYLVRVKRGVYKASETPV